MKVSLLMISTLGDPASLGAVFMSATTIALALALLFLPVLFIISLVQLIRLKSAFWIAACALCVIAGLFSVVALGVKGVQFARDQVEAPHLDGREVPADRRVQSDDGLLSLELPDDWKILTGLHEDATLQAGNIFDEEYLVLLTDLKIDFAGSLEEHTDVTSNAMLESMIDGEKSRAERIEINGLPAIRYEISGTIDNLRIDYIQTTVEAPDAFHQLLGWTIRSRRDTALPTISQAIQTAHPL